MKKILVLLVIICTVAGCAQKQTVSEKDQSYKTLVNNLKIELPKSFKPENPYTYYTIANTTHKTLYKVASKKRGDVINNIIQNYQKAIKLDPNFAPAYYGLGLVMYNNKDLKGAYVNFEKAVEINPGTESYHLSLALTCDKLKKEECAAQQYGRVIDINPKNIEAVVLLANIYLESKQYENAKELFEMALTIQPDNIIAKKAIKNIEKNHSSELLNKKTEEEINAEPEKKADKKKETDQQIADKINKEVKEELIEAKKKLDEE